MPFQYKKVLVLGATSGIGRAMASRLVQEGSYVIVVGNEFLIDLFKGIPTKPEAQLLN